MALAAGGVFVYRSHLSTSANSLSTAAKNVPNISAITALGRLEPQGEVIHVSAPASPTTVGGNRVEQLLVREGDKVEAGQIIAILDNHARLQAALKEAQKQVRVYQARLAQVKVGAKFGEIAAQKATLARLVAQLREENTAQAAKIARLKAEVNNAESEYQRNQKLYRNGAISASLVDSKRLTLDTTQEQLNEAKATQNQSLEMLQEQVKEAKANLNRIAEVRPTDVQAAQAELDSATASFERAQTDLDLAEVRAPRAGQVLKIHTWAGETVSNKGIIDLGQTNQMYVVAEIYETDINKVHLGQRATIIGDALNQELHGSVDHIGLQIQKKDVLSTDPAADVDARVVEVKIRLDPAASHQVAGLTNLQLKVAINI